MVSKLRASSFHVIFFYGAAETMTEREVEKLGRPPQCDLIYQRSGVQKILFVL